MFLQQAGQARSSFEQQILKVNEDGSLVHGVYCDLCIDESHIVGPRFVCRTCPDVDLCVTCMQKYPYEDRLQTCRGHEFLEVSETLSQSVGTESTKAIPEGIREWLRRLVERYSEPEDRLLASLAY